MIQLLAIQPVAERGGSDQALLRMLRRLPRDEFTCHVAVPTEPPLREEYEAAGVVVHIVPMARISRSHRLRDWIEYAVGWPIAVARLARIVRANDIDVVHSNSLHSWYGWAVAAITRRVHTWHAREIVVQASAALTVERFLARHFATTVICMSDAVAAQLHPGNLVVIREAADAHEFQPMRAGRFREATGIGDDVPLAGAAGRVDTWKGYDVLLDAYEIAKQSEPRLHLVVSGGAVAGKEWLNDSLQARAAAMPDVRWLGPRSDLPDVLADLDVFILSSTEPEPYGLVVVEALACGVPVIATDAGGPREIAADAVPGSVTLVAPRDAAALAGAIVGRFAAFTGSGTAARRRRTPLRAAEPERFAEVFRAAAASDRKRPHGR
jgi:glycosyltransferase involved in cell wall biosynthesis